MTLEWIRKKASGLMCWRWWWQSGCVVKGGEHFGVDGTEVEQRPEALPLGPAWRVTLDKDESRFLVYGPPTQVGTLLRIQDLGEGWMCHRFEGWINLVIPVNVNSAFVLDELLERVPQYHISAEAKEILSDLTIIGEDEISGIQNPWEL